MNKIDYSLYYKNWHNDSDEHFNRVANQHKDLLKPYVPQDKKSKILDIGCGFGFALKAMQDLGYEDITGIEVSPEQSAIASKRFNKILYTEDTISTLKSFDEKFDFVILMDVLEHVPVDIQIVLINAIFNIMNDGGKLFITVPNANSILSSRWRYNDYTHYSSFTEHSIKFILNNSGFFKIYHDNEKGVSKFPYKVWRHGYIGELRKYIVRIFWLNVFKAEVSFENLNLISFELNLKVVAEK
jgi:2-polyprenyl-3-methyl-5-hydroxy-6-metoxy-1,4-benzoquinol methylase